MTPSDIEFMSLRILDPQFRFRLINHAKVQASGQHFQWWLDDVIFSCEAHLIRVVDISNAPKDLNITVNFPKS